MKAEKTEMQMKEVITERYTLCDKCGSRVTAERFEAFEFELECRTGTSYPEGGSGQEWSLDLCQTCSPGLKKLLKDNGYNVQQKEWYH